MTTLLTPRRRLCRKIISAMAESWQQIHTDPWVILGFVLVSGTAFSGTIVAAAVDSILGSWVTGESTGWVVWIVLCIAGPLSLALGLLAWIMHHHRRDLSQSTFISAADPRPVLTCFVSTQRPVVLTEVPSQWPVTLTLGDKAGTLSGVDLLADADALEKSGLRWNWEQLLRAVHPHRACLKRLYLLGSAPGSDPKADPGSHRELELCKTFLQHYLQATKTDIIIWPHAMDFEDVKEVRDQLLAVIQHDEDEHGGSDQGLCIDITGGQKPASIAGTIVTLNRRATIQYVQTLPPKEAHRYDLTFSEPVKS